MYVHRIRTNNYNINNTEINDRLGEIDKSTLRKDDIIYLNETYNLAVIGFDGYIVDLVILKK